MEFMDEDIEGIVRVAYGPIPADGVLMTGEQMQRFARKTVEMVLKKPGWLATPPEVAGSSPEA